MYALPMEKFCILVLATSRGLFKYVARDPLTRPIQKDSLVPNGVVMSPLSGWRVMMPDEESSRSRGYAPRHECLVTATAMAVKLGP